MYHPTLITGDSSCFFFCYVLANCWEWSDSCFSYSQQPVVERTQNLLYIIQRRSTRRAFSFIIYQSTTYWSGACTQNLLYIIQRRSERLALFVCYISIIYLLHGVYRTQNLLYIIQRRSERLALIFICYISINYLVHWVECTQNLLYIIQRRSERLALIFICYISINCLLHGVYRTQNLLHIIQRRSERHALFVCYISINCLLPVVECTQNLLYIIQRQSARRAFSFVIYHSTACSGVYPKFSIYHPTPIDLTCFFFCYISFNCL
jgi:uncharacterized membrane protein YidH (DUF202 family)